MAFVPGSRYLVAATSVEFFVWDLLTCSVAWAYKLKVTKLVVDQIAHYTANFNFPSPKSLASCFAVTDGAHIFLFNANSPKPLGSWRVGLGEITSIAFVAMSSTRAAARIIYRNTRNQLIVLERNEKVEKKDKGLLSLSHHTQTRERERENGVSD